MAEWVWYVAIAIFLAVTYSYDSWPAGSGEYQRGFLDGRCHQHCIDVGHDPGPYRDLDHKPFCMCSKKTPFEWLEETTIKFRARKAPAKNPTTQRRDDSALHGVGQTTEYWRDQ